MRMRWLDENKRVDHAEQTGNSILHLTESDEPVLLEILNAREFIIDVVRVAVNAPTTAQP